MVKRRRLSGDDLAAWYHVRKTVTPLEERRALKDEIEHAPGLVVRRSHLSSTLAEEERLIKKATSFASIPQNGFGLHRSSRRAIRKGLIEAEAKLDLHGLRLEAAYWQFEKFIHQSARQGFKVVLVVTGKGGHRRVGDFGVEFSGVIRRNFPEWMKEREIARLVSHYTPAHIKHGGEGAWYVFIRAEARRRFSK